LAILITSNKALLYIADFFTSIYPMELKFELNTALTVKCMSAVALGFTKVFIGLANAQLAIANALVLLAIIFVLFGQPPAPKK
jgi:uncharacterized membrane protein YiaA